MSEQTYADSNKDKRTAQAAEPEEKYRTILEINNTIISKLRQDELFQEIGKFVKNTFSFDCAAICLYKPERDLFDLYASGNEMDIHTAEEFPREGSHSGWVFDNKEPVIVNDLNKGQRFATDPIVLEQGIVSYIVTPLISREKIIGTLNLGCYTPNEFVEYDTDFLSVVSKQIALAIDNARSHEEIEKLKNQLEMENQSLQEEIKTVHNFEEIIGESESLKEVLRQVEMVAVTDATVLIRGDTGTGKERIARAIHNLSPRGQRALIKVNCPAIPSDLIESELFGHEKGAFTGALLQKIGKFELADGGTIFLDELGDLPLDAQAKLLRILQEREYERVGGEETRKVDVRVIAATNRDLEAAVEEGKFRADLYYRLNVFPIVIPPLRERLEDIPQLAMYFTQNFANKMGKDIKSIGDETIQRLKNYAWPGNIRELENIVERSVILSNGKELEMEQDLFGSLSDAPSINDRNLKLEDMEREHIVNVLVRTNWQIHGEKGAAKILGINPNTLRSRMVKLGIKKEVKVL